MTLLFIDFDFSPDLHSDPVYIGSKIYKADLGGSWTYLSKYNDWQKKRYYQNQSGFIQAVISGNYVGINQQPRPKFEVTNAKFQFEVPKDMDTLKDKEGLR